MGKWLYKSTYKIDAASKREVMQKVSLFHSNRGSKMHSRGVEVVSVEVTPIVPADLFSLETLKKVIINNLEEVLLDDTENEYKIRFAIYSVEMSSDLSQIIRSIETIYAGPIERRILELLLSNQEI